MANRPALTVVEKERIYQGKLAGRTIAEMAKEIGCSHGCGRKWWRVGRDQGLVGIRASRGGRQTGGVLSRFDRRVGEKAKRHKQEHPRWGPKRVLVALSGDEELAGLALPSRSRLAVFFKHHCPELVGQRQPRAPRRPAPRAAVEVHQVWQMDSQEDTKLADGQVATICSIREPVAAAMLASQAFEVKSARRWRKLTITEIRQVLRSAFCEWGTLPNAVQTDNEASFGGNPQVAFPSLLTLWLVGLGVEHLFIRPGQPTDQPHVERQHRTLADFTWGEKERANIDALQQALDRERQQYHRCFPATASQCGGQPPLQAYPHLKQPRRPYHPDHELAIFNQQRVLDYLAINSYERKVSATGQVRLGGYKYAIGRPFAGQLVQVTLDPTTQQWLFRLDTSPEVIARCHAKGLDFQTLSGLQPDAFATVQQPLQLALPFFGANQGVRFSQDS